MRKMTEPPEAVPQPPSGALPRNSVADESWMHLGSMPGGLDFSEQTYTGVDNCGLDTAQLDGNNKQDPGSPDTGAASYPLAPAVNEHAAALACSTLEQPYGKTGLPEITGLISERVSTKPPHLRVQDLLLQEMARWPESRRLQERVGDVGAYIKKMLESTPDKEGGRCYEPFEKGGSGFVLSNGNYTVVKVLRLYEKDLLEGYIGGCAAIQIGAETSAGLPPQCDNIACFYKAHLIEPSQLLGLVGDEEAVNDILTMEMTGCSNGPPDALLVLPMERVYGDTLRKLLPTIRVPTPIQPDSPQLDSMNGNSSLSGNHQPYMACMVDGADVCSLISGALSSAKYLADRKVSNSDLKPENYVVFRDEDNKDLIVKMIDYDGAVPMDANGLPCYRQASTPLYSASWWGEVTNFDLFSLGVMGMELLAGTRSVKRLEAEAHSSNVMKPMKWLMTFFGRLDIDTAMALLEPQAGLTALEFLQAIAALIAAWCGLDDCSTLVGTAERPTAFAALVDFIYCLGGQLNAQMLFLMACQCMYGGKTVYDIQSTFGPCLEEFSNPAAWPGTSELWLPLTIAFPQQEVDVVEPMVDAPIIAQDDVMQPTTTEAHADMAACVHTVSKRASLGSSRTLKVTKHTHALRRCHSWDHSGHNASNAVQLTDMPVRLAISAALEPASQLGISTVDMDDDSMFTQYRHDSAPQKHKGSPSFTSGKSKPSVWAKVKSFLKQSVASKSEEVTSKSTAETASTKTKKRLQKMLRKLATCFTGIVE